MFRNIKKFILFAFLIAVLLYITMTIIFNVYLQKELFIESLIGNNAQNINYLTFFDFSSILKNNKFLNLTFQFYLISLLALFINFFFSDNLAKEHINKKNYSKILTKAEAKKGLVRLEFNSNGKLLENTIKDRIDEKINFVKITINSLFSLMNINFLLPTLSYYENNGIKSRKRAGLPIVTNRGEIYVDGGDNHSIIVGTTNSGKGYFIINTLISLCVMAGENIVVNDVKKELYRNHYQFLKDNGYEIYTIDFIEPKTSSYYNPILSITKKYRSAYIEFKEALQNYKQEIINILENLIDFLSKNSKEVNHGGKKVENQDVKKIEKNIEQIEILFSMLPNPNFSLVAMEIVDIARNISMDKETQTNDGTWIASAGSVIEGILFLLLEDFVIKNGEKIFLSEEEINFDALKLVFSYANKFNLKGKNRLAEFVKENRTLKNDSYDRIISNLDSSANVSKSVLFVLGNIVKKLFMSQDIINMMSYSDIDFFNMDSKKTAIFIVVHDEKSTYYSLTTIIFKQIYETMYAKARNNFKNGLTPVPRLLIPLNFIWDEFANGSKFEEITNALASSRAIKTRFYLVIQDYGQLEYLYKDKASTIKSNVMHTVFLLAGDNKTNKDLSEISDKEIVYNEVTKKYEEKLLFSISRLRKLKFGEIIFLSQRKDPFLSKHRDYTRFKYYKRYLKLKKENKYPLPTERELKKSKLVNIFNRG